MSTTLTINGVGYSFPAVGERPWAQKIINWATAVTGGMLQKSGGSFTLTAEVDFGATYGVKAAYFKSRTANISATGIVRLANNEGIGFRNATNAADLILKANGSDALEFAGVAVPTAAQVSAKMTDPMTADGDMIIRSGGAAVAFPKGSEGAVLVISGGVPTWLSPGVDGQFLVMVGGVPTWTTYP